MRRTYYKKGMRRQVWYFVYFIHADSVFQHKHAPFKVTDLGHWRVVLSSREHVEEIRRASDDTLSSAEAANEVSNLFLPVRLTCTKCSRQEFNLAYIMGPEVHHNPYHLPIVRARLTRNIRALYPEIIDEISMAFDDILGLRRNGEHLALICVCYL